MPRDNATVGEVRIRGPTLFAGYWRDPEATRRAFAPGGWFRTGDVVTLDHGKWKAQLVPVGGPACRRIAND